MAIQLSGRAATVTVSAVQWTAALAVLTLGRDPIAVHFNFAGEVDRWGDRREVALVIGGVGLLTLFGGLGLERLSRRRGDPADPSTRITRGVLLITTSLVVALFAALGFGVVPTAGAAAGTVMMACVSAILAAVGAYLGKVGPNPMMGIRTPWTAASRLAWDKSNRLAGRLLFWGGLAGLAGATFAPQPAGFRLLIAWTIVASVACVVESWRVWRTDPDRRSAL